jgi:hypothetical protein
MHHLNFQLRCQVELDPDDPELAGLSEDQMRIVIADRLQKVLEHSTGMDAFSDGMRADVSLHVHNEEVLAQRLRKQAVDVIADSLMFSREDISIDDDAAVSLLSPDEVVQEGMISGTVAGHVQIWLFTQIDPEYAEQT